MIDTIVCMSETIQLDDHCTALSGSIPDEILPDEEAFEALWRMHPEEHSEVQIHGRLVKVPRWDCAYERDYPFSHQVADAHPTPPSMKVFLDWAQQEIDPRLNGLFVNWHDGSLSHYHGKHRDSTQGLYPDSPILTISLGEERVFRLRRYPDGKPIHDVTLRNGDYIVIPWDTNQKWTHEVPKLARYKSRRISVTVRAFESEPTV